MFVGLELHNKAAIGLPNVPSKRVPKDSVNDETLTGKMVMKFVFYSFLLSFEVVGGEVRDVVEFAECEKVAIFALKFLKDDEVY